MNGIHDMGGMTDFGPMPLEPNEPAFHAEWHRRVFGLVRSVIDKRYNWDEFRFAIERLDPVVYLSSSYYERWLAALERYVVEKDIVTPGDLDTALPGWQPQPGRPLPTGVESVTGDEALNPAAPRFASGDRVRARNMNPVGHTRLPRYVRGRCGNVERLLGTFTFPDANALGLGQHPQPVYVVRFAARELWGETASARDSICVDLWEGYLARPDAL